MYYDVVIIGAGIAGAGLSYNLTNAGYPGKIKIIDANKPGANAGHNTRTAFRDVIEEYNLPFHHIYKGIISGLHEDQIKMDKETYSLRYTDICDSLLNRSNADYSTETAIKINNDILLTNKSKYRFKYLIDCTGRSFFLRRKFNLPVSNRFWIGKLREYKNLDKIDKDYMYFLVDENGYCEEFCPFEDTISVGDWLYSNNQDFSNIKPPNNLLRDNLVKDSKLIRNSIAIVPNSPHLPLVYKRKFFFLGDSFGNAPTSSCYGTKPILDTSKMLCRAIMKNKPELYELLWKEKYLEAYIRYLAVKYDLYHNSNWIRYIKNYPRYKTVMDVFKRYPEEYMNFFSDPLYRLKIRKEITKNYPKRQMLFMLYYYLKLKFQANIESCLY